MELNKKRVVEVSWLIDKTYKELEILDYSIESLKKFKYSFSLFEQYAIKNDVEFYSEKLALAFLEEYCKIFSNGNDTKYVYQERKRAISKLDEMHKYNQISSKRLFAQKQYQFYGCLQDSIESYLVWKQISISQARLKSIKLYLERFSLFISKINEIKNLRDLKSEHIIKFIESCALYTNHTVYSTVVVLRGYIVYLEKNGKIKDKISIHIPKIAKKRDRSYPSAFTKDETEALLNSIKRNNSKERRDYTMILLAARVGLRASDIANLKFSNIDWENNRITLVQQKTQTPLLLPLLNDVGEAIIDYVRNGRPKIDDPHIFIREVKPYEKVKGSSFHMIVDGYLKRANIKIPAGNKHGPHALRHSLATLLVENNIPISTIKEILAHKSSETTKIYLKIAQNQLLECALDIQKPVKDELCTQ
jgi:integrase